MKRITIGKVVDLLIMKCIENEKNLTIRKPMSNALYQVWKIIDMSEEDREINE